jgi:hypothetical protein
MFFQSAGQDSIRDKQLTGIEWHFLQDFEVILEVSIDTFVTYVAFNHVISAPTQSSTIHVKREHTYVGSYSSSF